MNSQRKKITPDLPKKTQQVLNLFLFALVAIGIRVWYLCLFQHDSIVEEANIPKKKVVIEPARRGTIRDRFNLPLAINKIQYRASILYSQIMQVPRIAWEIDSEGKKVRVFKRRRYIEKLSKMLAETLDLEPERVEDLIHSKASLYFHLPFVLKEELTEESYYRLKMREKDWPGLIAESVPKRVYPKKRTASEIIGYMGAIQREKYEQIIGEIKGLTHYITQRDAGANPPLCEGLTSPTEAHQRLKELKARAYTLNDAVGKSGIEGRFEEELRGFYGKKYYETDARGNFLKELPGSRDPLSGKRILLTISSELQEFAETLLIQHEALRKARISGITHVKQQALALNEPWIRGGAIVVMEPKSGELLALASYPRFDPNDFIASKEPLLQKKKQANINYWFETEKYLAAIWDNKRPLERERFDLKTGMIYEEAVPLNWEKYLSFLFHEQSTIKKQLHKVKTIGQAIEIQELFHKLFELSGQKNAILLLKTLNDSSYSEEISTHLREYQPEVEAIQKLLAPYLNPLPSTYDKLLFIDLCRLLVDSEQFTFSLLEEIGDQSPLKWRENCCALVEIQAAVKEMSCDLFHHFTFKQWREIEGKNYLKEIRREEEANGRYAKPYIDLYDQKEKQLFTAFWNKYKWQLLYAFLKGGSPLPSNQPLAPYFNHFLTWQKELTQGAHQAISWKKNYETLAKTVLSLNQSNSLTYLQALRSYSDLNRPLLGYYPFLRSCAGKQCEKQLALAFYPRYGYGYQRSFAFRQACPQGSVFKLVTAYEALKQKLNSLPFSPKTLEEINPLTIIDQVEKRGNQIILGYDSKGNPLTRLYKGGRLPKSPHRRIGEINLIQALEVSSNPYFALLASEQIENPEDLLQTARRFSFGGKTGIELPGEYPGRLPKDLSINKSGLYTFAIGQHSLSVTPLQTATMLSTIANKGTVLKPRIVKLTAGSLSPHATKELNFCPQFPYKEAFSKIGIDFPLFTAVAREDHHHLIQETSQETVNTLDFPPLVYASLIEGMNSVVKRIHKNAFYSLSHYYRDFPQMMTDWRQLKDQLIGKTGTGEIMERISLNSDYGVNQYNHIWFGGISYKDEEPELVVMIFLRFGEWGKDAAPLATEIVKKWREIQENFEQKR